MANDINNWPAWLQQLHVLLMDFREEKWDREWEKADLLQLQQQFASLLADMQRYVALVQQQLNAREELIGMWDDDRPHSPATKALFGQDQYAFYKQLWDELCHLLQTENKDSGLYIRLSITAMQLLFLVHLLLEAKVIEVPKKANLLKLISRHVGTLQQEKLSYDSLRKKYRTVDRNTILKVRRLLMDLVNLINNRHL